MNNIFSADGQCLEEFTSSEEYAEVLYKRATGELPEMETSKAMARLLVQYVRDGDKILDVGCGAGHFMTSFKREFLVPFIYHGVEYTQRFLDKALKAWAGSSATFQQGSIFDLPIQDRSFDITVCSNVLTHLPTIVKPISELIRVTKRLLVIRSPIGDRSYRIQQVFNRTWWPYTQVEPRDEFNDQGEPCSFSYENIHSVSYFEGVIKHFAPKSCVSFIEDKDFDPRRIEDDVSTGNRPIATRILDGKQVYGNILLPHMFAVIELD